MSRMATKAYKFADGDDPKATILSAVGDLKGFDVHGPRVLVAVYDPTKRKEDLKTKGGIIIPPTEGGTGDEYKYQGRACLVLKLGPLAFKDDEANKFQGDKVEVGDWVTMPPVEGRSILINDQLCRLVQDQAIEMTIPAPDAVL